MSIRPKYMKWKVDRGKWKTLLLAAVLLLLGSVVAQAQVKVGGNIYGGGEAAIVTGNDTVLIQGTASDTIFGTVYGGGQGATANVLGNTLVDMRTGHVIRSIYGGGELGSVGTFTSNDTVVYVIDNEDPTLNDTVFVPKTCSPGTGLAKVLISGGMVGIDSAFMPRSTIPEFDDYGYVFAAGKGDADSITNHQVLSFAVVDSTYLEISSSTLITASVYGGSENGLVTGNTHVKIMGGQIGTGHYQDNEGHHHWDGAYSESQWTPVINKIKNGTFGVADAVFHECDHWLYQAPFEVYDIFADEYSSNGGSTEATDGHSFFGSVFGGGSGYYPIRAGVWRRSAGRVNGNSYVEITGGHILTSVYGGNELTDVLGKATIDMRGGTVGVPRIYDSIVSHPVTCCIFGSGMGDPRERFNNWTFTNEVEINITGGTVFGSVFGGGEDGCVAGDVEITINHDDVLIGTLGYSYVDGNVFGGGRGFTGLTVSSGEVGGDITLNIQRGSILGSVYGGGRLGSVDGEITVNISGGTIGTSGTISSNNAAAAADNALEHPHGGNVFGGGMGRLKNLANTAYLSHWPTLAQSRESHVNITGGTISNYVYGGSEYGTVRDSATVIVDGDVTLKTVYGGGYGSIDVTIAANDSTSTLGASSSVPAMLAGRVLGHTLVEIKQGTIRSNVYGGGEKASVGLVKNGNLLGGNTNVVISGDAANTNIGNSSAYIAVSSDQDGHVFGGGKGETNDPNADYKLYCNVNNTRVTVEGGKVWGSVFGGSAFGHVLGNDSVFIKTGADIGTKGTSGYDGHVFGGGRGNAANFSPSRPGGTSGRVGGNNYVKMNGGYIRGNVYGGGIVALTGADANGWYTDFVSGTVYDIEHHGLATVEVSGGIIGDTVHNGLDLLQNSQKMGNVYGGGRGKSDEYLEDDMGRLAKSVVNISGEPVIGGSVFGGGQMANVGYWIGYDVGYAEGTGATHVTIEGSPTIGTALEFNHEDYLSGTPEKTLMDTIEGVSRISHTRTGNVFGGGQGDMVLRHQEVRRDTVVALGFEQGHCATTKVDIRMNSGNSGGHILSSVFGGSEQGAVWGNTDVYVGGGTIGTTEIVSDSVDIVGDYTHATYSFGSVFGGSYGLDAYIHLHDSTQAVVDTVNAYAGRIYGDTKVTIAGGTIRGNIFGGSNLGNVDGDCEVIVKDSANTFIGPLDGTGLNAYVFGGGKGFPNDSLELRKTFANVDNTFVIINGGTIYGSVYGGGSDSHVLGSTTVEVHGGNIGTDGLSTWDGNIFGGGRNLHNPNHTNGRVQGNISVTMDGGHIQGTLYGGGRLALSGVNEDGIFPTTSWPVADHGNVTINVSGTTDTVLSVLTGEIDSVVYLTNIGNGSHQGIHLLTGSDESVGDIFGSGKGDTWNYMDTVAGRVTNATIIISGSPRINGAVFGGGEMASLGWWNSDGVFYDDTGEATITIGREGEDDNPIIGTYLELNPDYVDDSFTVLDSTYNHSEWTMIETVNGAKRVFHTCTGNVFGGCQGDVEFVDPADNNWHYMGRSKTATVTINGGTIMSEVFGGAEQGMMTGNTRVIIKGGTIGTATTDTNGDDYVYGGVYGGGYGSDDPGEDNEPVTVFGASMTAKELAGRTYGDARVDILDGTIRGDVYGGAAFAYVGSSSANGNTVVNIGEAGSKTGPTGNATLVGSSVYGANNRSGMPYGDTEVNVYKTAHVSDPNNYYPDPVPGNITQLEALPHEVENFAIKAVYGGSNKAEYTPRSGKAAHVNVFECEENTIYDIYGGSNAADINANTNINLYGGRFYRVFGGGNGEGVGNPGANINGTATTEIYAGLINQLFGGSNFLGQVDVINLVIHEEQNDCPMLFDDIFGGGNAADIIGDVITTVECGAGSYGTFYGGSRLGKIYGDVTVNIKGGTFNYLFAGSKGREDDPATLDVDESVSADILKITDSIVDAHLEIPGLVAGQGGNITLNLVGGTIRRAAFGGSDVKGRIQGKITVNVLDTVKDCPLFLVNLYGAGRTTTYEPDLVNSKKINSPEINVIHGDLLGNIYGGGEGSSATTTANPVINFGYNATTMAHLITEGLFDPVDDFNPDTACVSVNNIYGGGNAGDVYGNPTVSISKSHASATTRVDGSVYGAGNGSNIEPDYAMVHGSDTVRINGGLVKKNVYGGGEFASITGDTRVELNGCTIGVDGLHGDGMVFGGGLGHQSNSSFGGVSGNTHVNISNAATVVKNSVFGGGSLGSVLSNAHVNISGGTVGVDGPGQADFVGGNVFGGSLGLPGGDKINFGNVDSTKVTISGDAYILGSVFGGGNDGHVIKSTVVNMTGGTIGKPMTLAELITDSLEHVSTHIYTGSLIGGGRGISPIDNEGNFNDTTGRVFGNAHVTVSGGTVRHAVYGGGGLSSVGTYEVDGDGKITNFINNTGKTYVTVMGNALIGPKKLDLIDPSDDELAAARTLLSCPELTRAQYADTAFKYLGGNAGWVFGAGCGLPDSVASVLTYNDSAFVSVSGYVTVAGSVFGGGENGHVLTNTNVEISGGIVGGLPLHAGTITVDTGAYKGVTVHLKANENELKEDLYGYGRRVFRGEVYGGGKGTDTITGGHYHSMAGRVLGSTYVTVKDTATIYNRVYGGGSLASVGDFTYYGGAIPGGVSLRDSIQRIAYVPGSGITHVSVIGGTIGSNGNNNGDIYGGGRGLAGDIGRLKTPANPADVSDHADQVVRLAYVGGTNVEVSGDVHLKRSIYGGSANGHVYGDTRVVVSGGVIGDTVSDGAGGYKITGGWKGSIYGGGGGSMCYKKGSSPHLSLTSGRVYGNTNVTVSNTAWILNNVYGGGAIASVGTYDLRDNVDDTIVRGTGNTKVQILGGILGYDGRDNGMVYGSGRGHIDASGAFLDSLSYVDSTLVIIGGENNVAQSPLIKGSVFGSGENGHTFHDAIIRMWRGTVEQHVFGSGSGIDTIMGGIYNPIAGIVQGNTQVNINGGLVKQNVYGGGEMAAVLCNTNVNINGGTVGVITCQKTEGSAVFDTIVHAPNSGSVFGGGKGALIDATAALVSGNSNVSINSGAVLLNVYGGGELGSVGQVSAPGVPVSNTGLATVTVTGGQVGPGPMHVKSVSVPENDSINIPIGLNGTDGYVFGGGKGIGDDEANTYYNYANVNKTLVTVRMPNPVTSSDSINNRLWGSIFGGAEDGHVLGNAQVRYISGLMGTTGTTSYDGNIFGGGRNYSKKNYTAGRVGGNTDVEMSGGQIYGSIFGGGRLAVTGFSIAGQQLDGEDHGNTKVVVKGGKVGNERLIETWTESTMGDVYGGGKGSIQGIVGHPPASALLISLVKNTEVEITQQYDSVPTVIYGSVFGGGEVANVGRMSWNTHVWDPLISAYTVGDIELISDGLAKVTVKGGQIGPDRMHQRHTLADGTYNLLYNDDVGHVFGGGEGVVGNPNLYAIINPSSTTPGIHNNKSLLDLMAIVNTTEVIIRDTAWVKGSVYGGSANGHVLGDASVQIMGGQIGSGDFDGERKYTELEFQTADSLTECPHWKFDDAKGYNPFDPVLVSQDTIPSDGKSWFGNVFGGGSGFYPYIVRNAADDGDSTVWNPESGKVYGNTTVEITGGHILTNVYGGCEVTDVVGDSTIVTMSGGTIGVPRYFKDITSHPLTCYLFGAGKGDTRTKFDTWTNVKGVRVEVSGGWIYGSVFGGGEEGHIINDAKVIVRGAQGTNVQAIAGEATKIGTLGYSYVDGNVFGAGRGFGGDALTAGVVGGNVTVNIKGGLMLGSIYGGGRLASVGTYLVSADDPNYGMMQEDDHGYINVNISGGTIGNDTEIPLTHTKGGNVFGGSMGRLTKLDGTYSDIWAFLGKAKQTKVTITGGTIKSNVYGGAEFGIVSDSATVVISGGIIERDVYGGGYGSDSIAAVTCFIPDSTITASPMQIAGRVYGNTLVKMRGGWVKKSVYGGGELASVGTITDSIKHAEGSHPLALSWPYKFVYDDATGNANIQITGGRVGVTGKDIMIPAPAYGEKEDNGDLYGGSKGLVGNRYVMAHCANVKTATITINIDSDATPENYKDLDLHYDCITGAVYGGGENGHVNDSTNTTLTNGLIGHAMYGGGKGKDTYGVTPTYDNNAGKVYGNTYLTIDGGYVVRSVFGGGNLASVGKGNYAGGTGDYNPNGYGEVVTNPAYWDTIQRSGHTYVYVNGGDLGILKPSKPNDVIKDNIPYGSVFGGCRGMAVGGELDYFGFVNYTHVRIGGDSGTGPTLRGSVYGGSQDGHVRWNTNVVVNRGEIGVDYDVATALDTMGTADLNSKHWADRGNVYGGGSGLSMYDSDSNGTEDAYSHIAGHVLQKAHVTINGGTIHRNVYGGGNLATVGPPRYANEAPDCPIDKTFAKIDLYSPIGVNTSPGYGGYVYGASRGLPNHDTIPTPMFEDFSLCSYTIVNINAGANVPMAVYGGGENGQVGTPYRKDQLVHTTEVNIKAGASVGTVYGGGQGVWGSSGYLHDTISGRVLGSSTVNIDGTVMVDAFGGGKMGVTHGETYVNVSGNSDVGQHVFGGAFGKIGQVHVLNRRMVNMRGGTVHGNVYGGSYNADDALTLTPGAFASSEETRTASVVNFSGGYAMQDVYGAGYYGNTFGSTYVFVGTNAILNAPNHAAGAAPYNATFYNDHKDLVVDRDVWAGADYGLNGSGDFGPSIISGRSDVYIDGKGYDTEHNESQGDNRYMILRNNVFGCGTLNDGGSRGKRIMVRNYGHAVATPGGSSDPEPWANATRTLYSIQYADSLIIDSSHVHFEGRGVVNLPSSATEKYAIYNIFDDVRVVNGSSLFVDKPVTQIGNLHSNVGTNLYTNTPSYTEVNYDEVDETDNKIRINQGTFVMVRLLDTTPNPDVELYGALKGFFHMMTDGDYNAYAYARPKQSGDSGNHITEPSHDYSQDGGFVSYIDSLNIYDISGTTVESGGIQMPYENHTPGQTKRDGDLYFRIWRYRLQGQSTYDIILVARADPDHSNEFTIDTKTLTLPAGYVGSYYVIKSEDDIAAIDYGTDIKTVNAGIYKEGANSWMYYSEPGLPPTPQFNYNIAEGSVDPDIKDFMVQHPNNVFGLTAAPSGTFAAGNAWLFCIEANDALVDTTITKWTIANGAGDPRIVFRLTYSKAVNNNFNWDPIPITMLQYNADDELLDEVTINVQINTETAIEQGSKVDAYALMTHTQGGLLSEGENYDTYTAKVQLPTYSSYAGENSVWTLNKVIWHPNEKEDDPTSLDYFDENTLVTGEPYDHYLAEDIETTDKFVGMTLVPSINFDNSNGWEAGYNTTPIDLGTYKISDTINPPITLGVPKTYEPFSFNLDLHYDSKQNVGIEGNDTIGYVELIMHFTNYITPEGINDTILVYIHRRGKGRGFYIDGEHGQLTYSGHNPNAAQPSLTGVFRFTDFEPCDTIYVVNKVTANKPLTWNGNYYNQVLVFRYNGGHELYSGSNAHYENYNDTYPYNPAYKGALIDVNSSMTIASVIIDGAYNLKEMWDPSDPAHSGEPFPNHLIAAAPLINVNNEGELKLMGDYTKSYLRNNYNQGSNGGAVNVNEGGALKMNHYAHIIDNHVENGYGGGVYLDENSVLLVSDNVTINSNEHVSGEAVDENVYISDYNTKIYVGTENALDPYGALDASARIGVTKTCWGTHEYMPVVYTENPNHYTNLLGNTIITDDESHYLLWEYPERYPNGDENYLKKLYFVRTWVDTITIAPAGFLASNIDSPEDLAWAISLVNGLNKQSAQPNANFTLTADIDMSDFIWVPIGDNDHPYNGTFNGNGHLVTGIHSSLPMTYKGMFGKTSSSADISNLQLVTDFYKGETEFLGGLVGQMSGSKLSNCESAGYLEGGKSSGSGFIGGIVGKAMEGSVIHSSFSVDTLCATTDNMTLGGLVGYNSNSNLYNAYSRPLIDGDNEANFIGGLVGENTGTVENCYTDIGGQSFPVFAYSNYGSGSIKYCYSNADSTGYVKDGLVGNIDPQGHGTYGSVLGRKELGYMYFDNEVDTVSPGNTYVTDRIFYGFPEGPRPDSGYITRWPGMLSALNEWVRVNPKSLSPAPTHWFRPTTTNINGDLPVLGFPKDSVMATFDADGRFLRYHLELDTLLHAYDTDKNSSLFLYGNATEVERVPSTHEKVFVNEDAVLLQKAGSGLFGNTTVGVTFDNSAHGTGDPTMEYDWHLMATPLSDAKIGTTYSLKEDGRYIPHLGPGVCYQNDPVDIQTMEDSYFPNGLEMGSNFTGSEVRWDFYNYFEPEYHWINLKRNKKNHFHTDASEDITNPMFIGRSFQPDCSYGAVFPHFQIWYWPGDEKSGFDITSDQTDNPTEDNTRVFIPGKGYMMAIDKDSYMSSTGTLNQNVSILVTAQAPDDVNGMSANKGSNLVGNPYQAYLDLDSVTAGNSWTVSKFYTYDADQGVYAPYTWSASKNPCIPSQYVHPHQGFFVITDEDRMMQFRSTMAGVNKNEYSYFRNYKPAYPLVNLFVKDKDGNRDLAIIEFNRPEVGGVNKIDNLRNANFKLYARFDGEDYGLLFTPTGTERVPVFFKTPENGTYTLSWSKHNGTFSYMKLIDNIVGIDYDMLTHDSYTFEGHATDYAARFYIVFSATDVDEYDDDGEVFAYFNGEGWVVSGSGQLELIDMLGHVLYADHLDGKPTLVHFNNIASGMYMLRLVNSKKVLKAQKIVIY